jgi:TcpE family
MTQRRAVVRSYQRLFSPERRIYAIDGRTLPIPGGVPLRWLLHAAAILLAAIVLAGIHPAVIAAGAGMAYVSAARLGRRREGAVLAAASAVALTAGGLVVGVVDWPLRLVVLPAVGATMLTQISPDGRSLPRYLVSLARVRIAGRRRLGAALPVAGASRRLELRVAVAADRHQPTLHRARITGPCRVRFAEPVLVLRRRRGVRLMPVAAEPRRRGVMVDVLDVGSGERVEVRP